MKYPLPLSLSSTLVSVDVGGCERDDILIKMLLITKRLQDSTGSYHCHGEDEDSNKDDKKTLNVLDEERSSASDDISDRPQRHLSASTPLAPRVSRGGRGREGCTKLSSLVTLMLPPARRVGRENLELPEIVL